MPISNGGRLDLEWFRDQFGQNSFEELDQLAEGLEPGSNRLLSIPHLSGRVCPNNPHPYPIYDNLVANLVTKLNSRCRFSPGLQRSDLLDYETYRDAIDAMVESLDLRTDGYKSLDQGLWVLAKYHSVDRLGVKTKDDQWLMDQVSRVVN